jgi:uncharacterized protein with PIN domain
MSEPTRLLADAMLGRLAKWLRLLGYDTLYSSTLSDHQIAARSRAEGRVVLTRDRELTRRRGIRCLFVESDGLEDQLRQVVAAFGAPAPGPEPRCPRCNATLQRVSPEHARPYVPPYVFKTHRPFHRCPDCDKVYWAGSHWKQIRAMLERVLEHGGDNTAE